MRPIVELVHWFDPKAATHSVNQSAPSGTAVMIWGKPLVPLGVGIGNSLVTTPGVVMRPILLARDWVNHRAPSGPAVMPFAIGRGDREFVSNHTSSRDAPDLVGRSLSEPQ